MTTGMHCPLCGSKEALVAPWNVGDKWLCWRKRGGCGAQLDYPAVSLEVVKEAVPTDQT